MFVLTSKNLQLKAKIKKEEFPRQLTQLSQNCGVYFSDFSYVK